MSERKCVMCVCASLSLSTSLSHSTSLSLSLPLSLSLSPSLSLPLSLTLSLSLYAAAGLTCVHSIFSLHSWDSHPLVSFAVCLCDGQLGVRSLVEGGTFISSQDAPPATSLTALILTGTVCDQGV